MLVYVCTLVGYCQEWALAGLCLLAEQEASDYYEGRQDDGIDNHGYQPEFGDGFLIHVCGCGCALAGGKENWGLQMRLLLRTSGLTIPEPQ